MEVSSHALALHRVGGTRFDVAVFTNLGRDHLDLHGTVERYFAAKALLFEPALSAHGVVNADDLHGRLTGFSHTDLIDLDVTPVSHSYTWRGQRVQVHIGGQFNAMNSLAAATAAAALGIEPAVIAAGLSTAPAVPGRFEPVRAGQPFDVIVQPIRICTGSDRLHRQRSVSGMPQRVQQGAGDVRLTDLGIGSSDKPGGTRVHMSALLA
jgi:UDP-N-acetylmuramoyl-L-alanyl-D-glutamate--2,6-diaminopimelate ligase